MDCRSMRNRNRGKHNDRRKTIITAHLAEDKLVIKGVKIGKNCLIGRESFIMPGVTLEDNVVVGAKSLITKNKRLKKLSCSARFWPSKLCGKRSV